MSEQENNQNQKESSPAPAAAAPAAATPAAAAAAPDATKTEKGEACGSTGKCCIGNFFKKSYSEHKTAYHVVGGVIGAVLVFHIYSKIRCGGSGGAGGGGCCH